MKRSRTIIQSVLALTLVSALLALGACSMPEAVKYSAEPMETRAAAAGDRDAASYEGYADVPASVEEQAAGDKKSPFAEAPAAPADALRKIISDAWVAMEVEDVKAARDQLIARVEGMGGYVASSSLSSVGEDGRFAYGNITLKVPSQQVNSLTDSLGELGTIKQFENSTEDITNEYYDIQSRLKNAEEQEKKLLEIMDQAKTVEEILLVRAELDEVQERIEQFKGQIQFWDQRVDYATVSVSLQAVASYQSGTPTPPQPMSLAKLWESIKNAFNSSVTGMLNFFSGLLVVLSFLLLPLLLIGAVALLIFLLLRRRQRRAKAKRIAAPEAPARAEAERTDADLKQD